MTDYKLTYFDMDGGRAEPIRIALHAAGIAFEDVRISFPEFMEMRDSLRFSCVPTLEIDGVVVTQSNAMSRYVGKIAGLYPEDALQALYCDEAMGAVEDLLHAIVHTFGLEGDELKAAREKLVDGWIKVFLQGLNEVLERGGDYIADNRLTVADIKVAGVTGWFMSGQLDHIPTDIVSRVAPALVAHQERVMSDPVIKAYYESRQILLAEKYLYAAYGSNLHPVRLQKRVPSATLLGTGALEGFEMRFNKTSDVDGSGKCSIKDPDDERAVMNWRIVGDLS